MDCKINDSVGVSPFVVIPTHKFVEALTQTDSCCGIKNGWTSIMKEILRNNLFIGVAQDILLNMNIIGNLKFVLGGTLDHLT